MGADGGVVSAPSCLKNGYVVGGAADIGGMEAYLWGQDRGSVLSQGVATSECLLGLQQLTAF